MTVTGFFAVKGNDVYVSDFLNNSVRRIAGGAITTVVGTPNPYIAETDETVKGTDYTIRWTSGVEYDPYNNVFYTAGGTRVVKFSSPAQ